MTGVVNALRFTRGLRFRLAFSYVFFFTILLVVLGLVFRQTLSSILENQMLDTLKEEFGAVKLYLRTDAPDWWLFDKNDPDESFTVERLRRVFMLADTDGHPLQWSLTYKSIGLDSPEDIRAILKSGTPATRIRKDSQGIPYMIHSGLMVDQDGHKYYLAIGRAIDQNAKVIHDFTWNYFWLVPPSLC